MRLASVIVSNFRAIANEATLDLEDMTALIGSNGTGKTTLLLAIEKFFSNEKGRIRKEDFNDPEKPIRVTVTVSDGGEADRSVTCEWKHDEEKKTPVSTEYSEGKARGSKYDKFLGDITVVHVPAEHETDDDGEDKRNSLWEKMVDEALRNKATLDAKKKDLQKRIKGQYGERLAEIKDRINAKLSGKDGVGYAPSTGVSLEFAEPEVKMGTSLKVRDLDSGHGGPSGAGAAGGPYP
ncbi:MAG: AAA family ATPase [Thaumarchaeota archaeon]|nr:AAA family ATPase [Nitrososphaerota archaeon]